MILVSYYKRLKSGIDQEMSFMVSIKNQTYLIMFGIG